MESRFCNESDRETEEGFTAEITFSGLGLLNVRKVHPWVPEESRGPRWATDLEMLLPRTDGAGRGCGHDGHCEPHLPRLTYYAEDHLGLLPWLEQLPKEERRRYEYVPSPEGREAVWVDLADRDVEIIPPWNYSQNRSELLWCPADSDGKLPDSPSPGQYCYLDWLLRDSQVGLSRVDRKMAVTRINLPHGTWRGRTVYINREVKQVPSPRPIRWSVKADKWSGGGERRPSADGEKTIQAMGPDLMLELHGLKYGLIVRISKPVEDGDRRDSDPHDIVLTPGPDRRLRFSLSNLPESYSEPDISHVPMYSSLSGQDPRELIAPEQADDVVCAQSACNELVAFNDAELVEPEVGESSEQRPWTKTARKGGGR